MTTLENLETEIEELRKEISLVAKTAIPALKQEMQALIQSSSEKAWTTLYDCISSNETLNLNRPSGFLANHGDITELPDLSQFSRLRVLYEAYSTKTYVEFDISDHTQNFYHVFLPEVGGSNWYCQTLLLHNVNEKQTLYVHTGLHTKLYYNNYPTFTALDSNSNCAIKKIEAK